MRNKWSKVVTTRIKRDCSTCNVLAKDIKVHGADGNPECPNCGTHAKSVADWNAGKHDPDPYT